MKSGDFSLELINAETKQPMKEFVASDGKVYVEAEPDLEYFIRCRRERGRGAVMVVLRVDGTKLGYKKRFNRKSPDLGLWKRENGVSTYRALKFMLRRSRGASSSSSISNTTPVGSVVAKFYETIYLDEMVEKDDRDKSNCLQQSSASLPVVAYGAKKSFASVSGCAITVSEGRGRWRRKAKRGKLLGELTSHYTSALGLSKLGILAPIPPPPMAAAAPDTINSSATTRNNSNDDDDDEDPVVIEESERKRVKTERSRVKPEPTPSSDLDGLTGNDAGAPTDNTMIDLTGED